MHQFVLKIAIIVLKLKKTGPVIHYTCEWFDTDKQQVITKLEAYSPTFVCIKSIVEHQSAISVLEFRFA